MENKEIIIDLSNEYKIKVETVEEFEKSIFSDVYKSAKENVLEVLQHSYTEKNSYDTYNNIIAFTGERGKGKSSAMISFLESLKSVGRRTENDDFLNQFYDEKNPNVAKYNFIALDVIDPSLFRGNETLFEIVLAKMFSKFKKIIENSNERNNNPVTDEDRRQLVKLFQNVFDNLKYTNGNNKDELYKQEALDALIKLSTSSNLRESFRELIAKYLKVVSSNGRSESILVISIDDFDLKIEGVYEMLEDVRQFLITENVIILIACKMEQMQQAVEITIAKHFSNPIQLKQNYFDSYEISPSYEISLNEIKNKARRYIEKLFPISRHILLPNTQNIKLDDIIKNTVSEKNDLKILETIFYKRNVFYSSDNYLNNLIYDDTLRSLVNLFHSLESADYNQFLKYCEIRFSEFLKPEQLNLILNCDYVLLNTFILKILGDEFYGHINEHQRIELSKLSGSSNYEIIQNADINAFLYVITKSLNINNLDFKKIKAICSIYNLRNVLHKNVNSESIKVKLLSGILTVKYIDSKNRIPQNSFYRKFRDYFKVYRQLKTEGLSTDQLIIVSSFVQNLGDNDSDYMITEENIFLNGIKRRGAPYQYYYFSIFTFLNAPNNISKLFGRFRDKLGDVEEIEKKWQSSYYSSLFSSYDFVIEFYEHLVDAYKTLSKSSLIKSEKDEDLHNNLIILFSRGIEQVFKKINEKYKYLNLDFQKYVEDNIILKIFLKNQTDRVIQEFINDSFDKYEHIRSFSSINSLTEIQYVNNIGPLDKIFNLLEHGERINRKPLQDLINEIDDQDSDLRDFLLQKNYFENLFSNSKNKRENARNELKKHLKRLIENG